jgi:lipoprotein-anchoring transpeptidase ErfK/SrfK
MISDKQVFQLLGLSVIMFFSQCGLNDKPKEDKITTNEEAAGVDTSSGKQSDANKPEPPKPSQYRFSAYPLKGVDTAVKAFKKKYSASEQYIILALNRLDAKHIGRADTLIIPEKIDTDLMAYSPFPVSVDMIKDIPKVIFFSYPVQAFGVYENGKLVYWGPSSMGSKIHPTPTGLHFTNWKGKQVISTVNDEWKLNWNFNIANKEGVGWHEYDLPGYPASHSCLRLLADQAKWLYDWGEQWILDKKGQLLAKGTPVIVYGEYPWGQRRPWKNLLENPDANTISESDLNTIVQPFMEEIQKQLTIRQNVLQSSGVTAPVNKNDTLQ